MSSMTHVCVYRAAFEPGLQGEGIEAKSVGMPIAGKALRRLCCLFAFLACILIGGVVHAQTPLNPTLPGSALGQGIQQVAMSEKHTCALSTDGTVQCWGANDKGQLGDGSTTARYMPAAVKDSTGGVLSGVAVLVMGYQHTCALTTAGTVLCWGGNGFGQLGNNSNTNSSTAVVVKSSNGGDLSGVAALVAGNDYTCALTTAGTAQCWGVNGKGQLGDGTTTNRSMAVAVKGSTGTVLNGLVALATGGYHTCALTSSGNAQCWGLNNHGQLGDGSSTDRLAPVAVKDASGNVLSGLTALAAGAFHSCALSATGTVQCWGYNYYGQLGDGSNADRRLAPVAVVGSLGKDLVNVTSLAAGWSHTCALTTTGAAQCWGHNLRGQLGDGSTTSRNTAVAVKDSSGNAVSGMASLGMGFEGTCAVTTAGAVQCWGANTSGQLGDGTNVNRTTPVYVNGLSSGVAALAAGMSHTCALTTAGTVYCWGYNFYGQLGDGTINDRWTPVAVKDSAGNILSGVAELAAGNHHSCVRTKTGNVLCWGYNGDGQLGDGSTDNRYAPVIVKDSQNNDLSSVAALAAGGYHTCALTTAKTVQCWGHNGYGQLGNDSTVNSSKAVVVVTDALGTALDNVTALAAGGLHTCALTASGAQCWGYNQHGQLGDNSFVNRSMPVDVQGLTSVNALTMGENHTCALTATGGAQCWGRNAVGQLGDGTSTDSSAPVGVQGLSSGVAALGAGLEHTCAATVAGTVQCWGYNNGGQLGNGGTSSSNTPVTVQRLTSGVNALASGGNHVCALTNAGAVWCWGANGLGQLGNDSATSSSVPLSLFAGQQLLFAPGIAGTPLPTWSLNSTIPLSAISTASTGAAPITYDVWTPDTCSVSGNTLVQAAPATPGSLCGVRAMRAAGDDGASGSMAAAPAQSRLLLLTKAAPTLDLVSAPNPSDLGTSVTLTATFSGAANPTGVVNFLEGATTLCSTAISGTTASCSVSGLAVGSHSIHSVFAGDGSNAAATSNTLTQIVNALAPSAPSAVTAVAGDGQATVSWNPANDNGSALTGYTVTASPGGRQCAAAANQNSCTVTGLTNGTAYAFVVTATNAIGPGPNSAPSVPVTPLSGLALTAPGIVANAKVGQPYSLTLAASGGTGNYSYVVMAGTLPAGLSLTPVAGGVTIGGTPTTAAGAASITVQLKDNGNSNNATNTATAVVSIIVNATGSSVLVSSSINPSRPGDEVTFTVTVTPDPTKAARALTKAVPVPPTGTITVTDNGITLGTAPLVNGSATLTVKTLTTPGTHFIVASYSGDANNAAAQSTPFMQIVAMAANTASVPVPMLSEWWAKLLMSLMLLGCASLGVCMRRA